MLGLRDRAMMEVLYSTGIRRHELARARALAWVAKYLDTSRPQLSTPPESAALFLSERGERLTLNYLMVHMRVYLNGAKLGKTGSCHIFRHSMATLMLEGGADVRMIQEILGTTRRTRAQRTSPRARRRRIASCFFP